MSTDRRAQLVDLAVPLAREGAAGLTYARLAAAAGMRKPSLTYHFPSKEDLLAAVLEREAERLEALRARALACPVDQARELLLELLDDLAGIGADTAILPHLLGLELATRRPELAGRCRELTRLPLTVLLVLLGRAVDAGSLPPELPVYSTARSLHVALQGATLDAALSGSDELTRVVVEEARARLQGEPT